MTAPVLSVTVPLIEPRVCWPNASCPIATSKMNVRSSEKRARKHIVPEQHPATRACTDRLLEYKGKFYCRGIRSSSHFSETLIKKIHCADLPALFSSVHLTRPGILSSGV